MARRISSKWRVWTGLALACLPLAPGWAEWTDPVLDLALEARHSDNVNNAFLSSERQDDRWIEGRLSAGRYYQFDSDGAGYTRLRLTGDVALRRYGRYDGLDLLSAGVGADLTHKFGVGPDVPWLRLHAGGAWEDFEDDDRDSALYRAEVRVGRRFTERLDASLGAGYERRDGSDSLPGWWGAQGDVYDLERYNLSAEASYLIDDGLLARVGASYLNGDLDGGCTRDSAREISGELGGYDAYTRDETFGGCRYRFSGSGFTLSASLSKALGPHAALNFGVDYGEAGRNGLTYADTQLFIDLRYGL